jgi:hypothetical protein
MTTSAQRMATLRERQRSGLIILGITLKRNVLVDKLIAMKFLDPDADPDDLQMLAEATQRMLEHILESDGG